MFHATAPPDPTCHFLYYAKENGFYRELGLNVELNPVRDDLTAIRAVLSGEGQIAWAGFPPIIQAIEKGAPLRIISSFAPKLDYKLVAVREITRPKDLEGKTVAVSAPGAISHEVPTLFIRLDGGDPRKANVLSVGGSQSRLSALIARRVQAAALNGLFADRAIKYDYLHVIGVAAEKFPDFLYAQEFATAGTISARRDAVQAFVDGTRKAVLWFYGHVDEAAAISHRILPDLPEADLAAGIRAFARSHFWSESGELPVRAFGFSQRTLATFGDIKKFQQYNAVYVKEFVERARRDVPR